MSEPYLILHKVRGAPAFDIAERWSFDGEEGWIISTSGHRAYPYWSTQLSIWDFMDYSGADKACKELPSDWPDHYACNDRPIREDTYTVATRARSLLQTLGLVKPVKVERRD